jgi:hypothetical protein
VDTVWAELIRAAPWGAVIVILRWLDIKAQADRDKERDANAKEKAEQDRQTQITISQTYASAINSLNRVTEMSSSNIVESIKEFKETVIEQYRKMGATQEIVEMAVDRAVEKMKDEKKA